MLDLSSLAIFPYGNNRRPLKTSFAVFVSVFVLTIIWIFRNNLCIAAFSKRIVRTKDPSKTQKGVCRGCPSICHWDSISQRILLSTTMRGIFLFFQASRQNNRPHNTAWRQLHINRKVIMYAIDQCIGYNHFYSFLYVLHRIQK